MSGSFIDDLRDIPGLNDFDAPSANPHKQIAKEDERERFPCEACAGTGRYLGARVHQEKAHCFACKGKGYFFKSYGDRMKARQQAAARKATALSNQKADFDQAYPGLIEGLRSLSSWNEFAASLVNQYEAKGSLSDKQAEAGLRQVAKAAERDAKRAIEREKKNVAMDASRLHSLFEKAKASGLKHPGLWFGEVKLSLASTTSANAGAIYVKIGDAYQGKVVDGVFKPVWGADASVGDLLLSVAENPAEKLREIGKQTNRCCCCGRTLTDPVSVANGIGPICAENWGV